MATMRLSVEHTALLVVDVQEKFAPHIHAFEPLVAALGRLIEGCTALDVPILVTEQHRKGLGRTVPALLEKLGGAVCNHEKLVFSGCIEPIRRELARRQARCVLVCGIEAHVCVLQTCLDLMDGGYVAFVAVDAIGSRRPGDRDAAIQRMIQAGVVPTTGESALLEMVHEAGSDRFRAILPIIR